MVNRFSSTNLYIFIVIFLKKISTVSFPTKLLLTVLQYAQLDARLRKRSATSYKPEAGTAGEGNFLGGRRETVSEKAMGGEQRRS
jgi:hypothetical protein